MNQTLTVICPVYNEEKVIKKFYDELRKVLIQLNGYESKILFVVDRSTDSTLDILKEIINSDRSVQIIALSSRFGHQMALLAGIDNSFSDVIIMMDADLQHPPSLIPQMLKLFEDGYDIVQTIRKDSPEIGFFKQISSKLFYKMVNLLSDVPIHEGSADFRLISRRVADVFRNNIRERNQFMRGLFSWVGFNSIYIPFQSNVRMSGESKYSINRLIRFGIQGIISFSRKPLQATVIVGAILASISILYSIIVFIQYFLDETLPSGWATLTILISFFSGIQLIFLGIVGEYIAAIFDEVKGRPHYIIEEKINF